MSDARTQAREALLERLVTAMKETAGDPPDLKKIADWAARYAVGAYKDGYRQGQQDTMISLVKEMMSPQSEDGHAIDFSAELQQHHSRGSGGASGAGTRASHSGGAGVSAGQGIETGEGVRQHRTEIGDGVPSTGPSTDTVGPGDS